jgi:Kef-type K+ transport system membrane component KefB/Trk K+ transport system NAD-binding subunit
MNESTFQSLLLLTVLSALTPIVVRGLRPIVRLPIVVAEILLGMAVGVSGLGLVHETPIVSFLAEFGFIFLMFLSGLEIDLGAATRGRGADERRPLLDRPVVLVLIAFSLTLGLAMTVGVGLTHFGMAKNPFLMALILSTTSLGVVVPVLKERGIAGSPYGQLVVLAAALSDFLTLFLLGLAFAFLGTGRVADTLLFGVLLLAFLLTSRASRWAARQPLIRRLSSELAHATAQIRVRWSFAIIVLWVVLASSLGIEVILGAFLAGAVIAQARPAARRIFEDKLDAIGYGFFIPLFFITVGARFDLSALSGSPNGLVLVPILVLAAFAVKVLPALIFRRLFSWRESLAAGFLLSSRLSLIIAAAEIARELDIITSATNTAILLVAIVTCTVSPLLFARLLPPEDEAVRKGVLLVGTDSLAELLATRLIAAGEQVSCVGVDDNRLRRMRDAGCQTFAGASDDPTVLAAAGAATAASLVALTSDRAGRLGACRHARERFGVKSIVARAHMPEEVSELHALGVQVVQPALAMVLGLEGALHFPAGLSMLVDQHDGFDLADAPLLNPDLVDRALRDVPVPGKALVIGIRRVGLDEVVVPSGDTVLRAGDVLVLCGNGEAIAQAARWIGSANG